jgi:diacylglycerol diphosphate phosphatase / phosphatidate phosphatase
MPPAEETDMPLPRRDTGLAARRGLVGSIARFWSRTYAPDYVALVFLTTAYIVVCLFIF